MDILQQKLRTLRSWQGLTLAACAKKADLGWNAIKWHMGLEGGDSAVPHREYDRHLIALAHAYGIVPKLLEHWLEEEYDWRVSANSGNPETLPRLARYRYRPLPEAAHNLFRDGFVVLDTETTGVDPHAGTRICEITILDTDGVVLLNSLVNPEIHIPDELTANVHGISDEMVRSAPTFKEIYPAVAQAIEGQTVVVYNANYDCYLLDRLIIENDLRLPRFDQWCLMEAYKVHIKAQRWIKLGVACEQQQVAQEGEAHRSLADTFAVWRLLQKLALQHTNKQGQ